MRRSAVAVSGVSSTPRCARSASLIKVWYPFPVFSESALKRSRTTSSKYIVMRVLPSVGSTAPRLALEKSYSFFIGPDFLRFRPARRDDARVISPQCVYDYTEFSEHIHSD